MEVFGLPGPKPINRKVKEGVNRIFRKKRRIGEASFCVTSVLSGFFSKTVAVLC